MFALERLRNEHAFMKSALARLFQSHRLDKTAMQPISWGP
jgi:hypothetical protein